MAAHVKDVPGGLGIEAVDEKKQAGSNMGECRRSAFAKFRKHFCLDLRPEPPEQVALVADKMRIQVRVQLAVAEKFVDIPKSIKELQPPSIHDGRELRPPPVFLMAEKVSVIQDEGRSLRI